VTDHDVLLILNFSKLSEKQMIDGSWPKWFICFGQEGKNV